MQTHCPVVLSHTEPGTDPLGSQKHGTQPWGHPSDGTQKNMRKNCWIKFLYNVVMGIMYPNTLSDKLVYFNDSNCACFIVFSYSGGVNSCYSSCGHSLNTVCPPPPLGMGIVQSTYRTHPRVQCHGCHTHKADSPGSYAAPGCGNHDDKYHRDGLPHVPKIGGT